MDNDLTERAFSVNVSRQLPVRKYLQVASSFDFPISFGAPLGFIS